MLVSASRIGLSAPAALAAKEDVPGQPGGGVDEVHDRCRGARVGILAPEGTEPEPEVQRGPDHHDEVGRTQGATAGAGDEERMLGQHTASIPLAMVGTPWASTNVQACCSAPSSHTSEPRTTTGRTASPSRRATRSRSAGSASWRGIGAAVGTVTSARAKTPGDRHVEEAGPRGAEAASRSASSTWSAIAASPGMVAEALVTGASSGR